jgi:BolA protein
MSMADTIAAKLNAAFALESLKIVDESHLHAGHAGHRGSGESHYRVYIVAAAFSGKSRVERHRMVNAALAAELRDHVHALAVHARSPDEPEPSPTNTVRMP